MTTFQAMGKLNLTILVSNFGIIQVIKNILYSMFAFRQGSLHISKDVSYGDDIIILSFVYQVSNLNP